MKVIHAMLVSVIYVASLIIICNMVLRDRLMEAIGTLGLYGMKVTLDEILAAGIKSRVTPEKILCDLLEAEMLNGRSEASVTA